MTEIRPPKVAFLVTEDWYFLNHRSSLAVSLLDSGSIVTVACNRGVFKEKIRGLGLQYYPIKFWRRSLNPFLELFTFLSIIRFLLKQQPTILHCVSIKPIIYGAIASRLVGLEGVVCAVTGLGGGFAGDTKKSMVIQFLLRNLLKIALGGKRVRVLFENPDDLRFFKTLGIIQEAHAKLILGSGVDTQEFSPIPEVAGKIAVVAATRMLWAKGIGQLVEAARLLKRRGVDCRTLLVGDADTENPDSISRAQLQAWSDEGIVEWMGPKDRCDMPAILQAAHIVVLPSYYREGVPMTLIEAASCGKPIVTTDMPGCREIVEDRVNGYLVSPRDPVELAKALEQLIENAKLRASMGHKGRELVLSRFSKEIVFAHTLAVYQELLSSTSYQFTGLMPPSLGSNKMDKISV